MSRIWSTALLLSLCVFGSAVCSASQGASIPEGANQSQEVTPKEVDSSEPATTTTQSKTQQKEENKEKVRRGAFVAAPIPTSNPATGTGVVLSVGYIFPFSKNDKISPPSVIGAAGLFTDNGTRGFAVVGQLYFKENTYKITSGFVRGNVNYDLYGSGISAGLKLPLEQTGQVFLGEFQRRIGWKFFLGPRFLAGNSIITVRPNPGSTVAVPPDVGLHTTLTAVGITLSRDTSLNRFYPTSGTYFTFTSNFFSQTLGSKYSFQSYRTSFAKYWSLSPNQVLASDAYFCATGGHPPFYGNCIYGTNNDLRGYVAGKYFDRYMFTTQVEYRLALPMRLGIVAFGGVGEAFPGGDQLLFRNSNFLPSGGGGVRFLLSRQYHVNLRADIAQGKDGHTFSLGIGEAF